MAPKYIQKTMETKLRVIEEYRIAPIFKPTEIARNLTSKGHHISPQTVTRIVNRFLETGSVDRRHFEREDSLCHNLEVQIAMLEQIQLDDSVSAGDLIELIPALKDAGESTVRRIKRNLGFLHRTRKYCQLIREQNRIIRFGVASNPHFLIHCLNCRTRFCELMLHQMDSNDYKFDDMIFVDECKVEVLPWSRTCCVRIGEAVKSKKPKPKHPMTCYIFAGISKRGRTILKIFDGIMCAIDYVQILDECILPWAHQNYPCGSWKLWMDNDPKHTSKLCQDYIQQAGIDWFRTPAESPDLNPIEMMWSYLKWYLQKKVRPKTLEELKNGIIDFWTNRMTVELCRAYIRHMKKAVPAVIEAKGAYCGH